MKSSEPASAIGVETSFTMIVNSRKSYPPFPSSNETFTQNQAISVFPGVPYSVPVAVFIESQEAFV